MGKMKELKGMNDITIPDDPIYGQQYHDDDNAYRDYYKAQYERTVNQIAADLSAGLETTAFNPPMYAEIYKTIPQEMDTSNKGLRYNKGKRRLSLLSPIAMLGTTKVLEAGARKYADHNWRKGLELTEIVDSLMRHLLLFQSGESHDDESGLPHVDHIACNVMFLQEQFYAQRGSDGRFKDEINLQAVKELLKASV